MASDDNYYDVCLKCVDDCIATLSLFSGPFLSTALAKQLYSAKFNFLCKAQKWDVAYNASLDNPDYDRKVEQTARLGVKMCEAGQLKLLCDLPMSIIRDEPSERVIEVFEVVVRGLVESGMTEEAAAVCASRGEWRRAADLAPDWVGKSACLGMVDKESHAFLSTTSSSSSPSGDGGRTFLNMQDTRANAALELAKTVLEMDPSDDKTPDVDSVFTALCGMGMIDEVSFL